MNKLFHGIMKFRREEFERHSELFRELGRQQKPHTLFIGCSDSRVGASAKGCGFSAGTT